VETPEGESVIVEQTYERATDDGYFVVTVTVDASRVTDVDSYGGYVLALPDGASVISASNLTDSAFRGYELEAGESTDTARLRYRVAAEHTSECSDDPSAYTSVDQGSWAFTSRYDTGVSVVLLYEGQSAPDVTFDHRLDVEGAGYGGNGFAYMGAHETYERSIDGQNVTLVVPNAATGQTDPGTVFGSIASASGHFDVGKRSDRVVVFAAPDPMRAGGAAVGTWNERSMDAWVYAGATLDEPGHTWIHEYVHTRQAYAADFHLDGSGTNTSFLVEGGADYFASLLSLRAGNTTFEAFHADVNTSMQSEAVLGDQPVFGCNGVAKYTKGRRVLAALDAKIRADTGGTKTFADVYAKLNADDDGRVTYAEFKEYVRATTGTSYDAWLDKYVKTAAVPSVPDDPFAFASDDADDDGDGLETATERAANTSPFSADSDGDGLDDGREVNGFESEPTAKDTDGDGVPDGIEVEHEMNPTSVHSDDDGIRDDVEWQDDVLDAAATDTDGDGLPDDREKELGTKPGVADSDDDGLADGPEVDAGADPTVADSDGDGLADGPEVDEHGSDPTVADSDDDGLDDGDEVDEFATDPTAKDTDGDGVADGVEIIEDGTDPTDASDYATGDATSTTTAPPDGGDATATTAASDGDGNEEEEVVGPSTVPGFSVPAAVLAVLAGSVLLGRRRD